MRGLGVSYVHDSCRLDFALAIPELEQVQFALLLLAVNALIV